jgi:hypothetical protein
MLDQNRIIEKLDNIERMLTEQNILQGTSKNWFFYS